MGRFHQPRQCRAERLREFTHLTPEALSWVAAWLDRMSALGAPQPFIYGLPDGAAGDLASNGVHLEWDREDAPGEVGGWRAALECGPGPGRYLHICNTRYPMRCDDDVYDATVTLDDATTERIAAVLRGIGDLP